MGYCLARLADDSHARVEDNMAAKSDNKVIITCAITGSIHTPTMSDALPITPDQIAQQAIAAAEAGAAILHLHAQNAQEEHDQCGVIKRPGIAKRDAERRGARAHIDAVIAICETCPPVSNSPDDLTQCQSNHQKADTGRAQRKQREHSRGCDRYEKRCAVGDEVAVSSGKQQRRGVARHCKQAGMRCHALG